MSDVPAAPNMESLEDFHEARFQVFRTFSIRLAFFISVLPLVSFIPHWFLNQTQAVHILPFRFVGPLAWLAFPVTILLSISRKVLPWVLYGCVVLAMITNIVGLTKMGQMGTDYLWSLM